MIIGEQGDKFLGSTEASLIRHNVPYERFGSKDAKRRYPNVFFPEHFEYVIDKSGGVLRADRVLRAFQVRTL